MNLQKDIADFKNLDQQKKGVLFALIFVLFIISVLVGAYFSRGPLTQKAITTPTQTTQPTNTKPTTTLAINPAKVAMTVGKSQRFSVTLAQVPVSAADIVIAFDPAMFTVSGVTNGEVFSRVIRNKVETGKVVYSASISPATPNDTKTGVVFSFLVTPKKAVSSALLDFDHVDTITAQNGENTLGLTTGATVEVK